jgi:hypothetical protein
MFANYSPMIPSVISSYFCGASDVGYAGQYLEHEDCSQIRCDCHSSIPGRRRVERSTTNPRQDVSNKLSTRKGACISLHRGWSEFAAHVELDLSCARCPESAA